MTEAAENLNAEVRELAGAVEDLPPRCKAAIFGTCGRVFAPLSYQAEQRSQGRWSSPNYAVALDVIEAFANGSAQAGDHQELRLQLVAAPVSGDYPWSTYAQDAIICTDGGLAAASVGDSPKSELIYYALEPLICSLENRDIEVIRTYGNGYWSREIIKDPAMARAIEFLRNSIERLSRVAAVDALELDRLVSGAAVLRPAET
jgi:hypothetical protein